MGYAAHVTESTHVEDVAAKPEILAQVLAGHLLVSSGTVLRTFTQRTNRTFEGPAVIVDAPICAGMSGGPVFLEDGSVCGVLSASGLSANGQSASFMPLYPGAFCELDVYEAGQLVKRTLRELIERGRVETDGSESRVVAWFKKHGLEVGVQTDPGELEGLFNDYEGFLASDSAHVDPTQPDAPH